VILLLLLVFSVPVFAQSIDWDAQAYFNNSAPQQQMALSYFQNIAVNNPKNILDIGCGDGKITAFIAQKYPNATVIGIDNSPDMIAFAQSHFGHIPNLSFECIDAASIGYSNQFDLIVSFFCLHWVTDQDAALRALARAAVSGAEILLLFSVEPDQPILRAMRYANTIDPFYAYFSGYEFPVRPLDPEKTIALLADLQCKKVSYSVDAKADVFTSEQEFYNFLHAMPLADAIPISLFDDYVKVVADQYLYYCPVKENGNVLYATPIGVLHAQKQYAC